MQLREYLPFDVRDVMRALPPDGSIRHAVRQFVLNTRTNNHARSVKAFAEEIGFVVDEVDLPHGMNGRLVPCSWSDTGYRIEINKKLSVQAKRFAVLHEVAHYFLHIDHHDPLPAIEHFDPSGSTFYIDAKAEREANEFAEALLFGAGQLGAAVGLFGEKIDELARYFGVTEKVVAIALSKLKEQGGAAL